MASIEFTTSRGLVVLDLADAPWPGYTLLDAVRAVGLPLGQSCRGEGVCRSCTIFLDRGADAVSPPSAIEARFGYTAERRLACQVEVPVGLVNLRVHHPSWGRPPPPAPSTGPDGTLKP